MAAWAIYAFYAFVGPVSLLTYSGSLDVDGPRYVWKRWLGRDPGCVERTRRVRALRIFLASGPTIRFTRYARNYGKLIAALGVSPEAG